MPVRRRSHLRETRAAWLRSDGARRTSARKSALTMVDHTVTAPEEAVTPFGDPQRVLDI